MVDPKADWLESCDSKTRALYRGEIPKRRPARTAKPLGERLALPVEDPGEVDRRLEGFAEDLAPRGELARFFVRRVTVLTVRLDRSVDHETASLASKIRRAEADFDEARIAEADHILGWILAEPISHRRKLLAMPEGVDCLIKVLLGLKEDLDKGDMTPWTYTHLDKLESSFGRRMSEIPHSRGYILSEAMSGKFDELDPAEVAHLDTPKAKRLWTINQLKLYIDAEVDRLLAHKETLDLESIALDRAEAKRRATFDASPEAILARRYEASTEKALFRTLREIRRINDEAEGRGVEAPIPQLLGSFRAEEFEPEVDDHEEVAAEADRLEAQTRARIGFVPSRGFSGPADTGSGVRADHLSTGSPTDFGGHNRR